MSSQKTISFTEAGYQKMIDGLAVLKKEREEVVIRLRTAREMGDLSENGAYKAARFELSSVDHQIRKLTYLIQSGAVIKKQNINTIGFGNIVELKSDNGLLKFTLVDRYESDPSKHMLSFSSPVGKAVFGKKVGDVVSVNTPRGNITYTVHCIA